MSEPHDLDDVDGELLAELMQAEAAPAPPALKDRLLRSIKAESRFGERFAERMASMCDLAKEKAREYLDALDDAARWTLSPLPELELFHVDGGPRVATAIVGFIRMPPGASFPEHTHVGDEVVLILQGGYVDSEGVERHAGDEHRMQGGTTHGFTALPGPDLLYFSVALDGFNIGEAHFGPDTPDA